MGRNVIAASIIILTIAVTTAAGYLYYQKRELEKNREISTEAPSTLLVNGDKLPVTDNPDGMSVPVDPSQNYYNLAQGQKRNDLKNSETKNYASTSVNMEINSWKIYESKKYGYSFKYPVEFDFRNCTEESPCRFGQVFEKDGGDLVYLAAQTNQRGWPYITVVHYNNENFTLPKGQKLVDWVKQRLQGDSVPQDYNYEIKTSRGDPKKAVRVSFPQTPQAYAREEIYFSQDNNIFQIQLLDTNKSEAWGFYNPWLENFVWQ